MKCSHLKMVEYKMGKVAHHPLKKICQTMHCHSFKDFREKNIVDMYIEYRHINLNHEQGQHYKMEGLWQTECACVSRK